MISESDTLWTIFVFWWFIEVRYVFWATLNLSRSTWDWETLWPTWNQVIFTNHLRLRLFIDIRLLLSDPYLSLRLFTGYRRRRHFVNDFCLFTVYRSLRHFVDYLRLFYNWLWLFETYQRRRISIDYLSLCLYPLCQSRRNGPHVDYLLLFMVLFRSRFSIYYLKSRLGTPYLNLSPSIPDPNRRKFKEYLRLCKVNSWLWLPETYLIPRLSACYLSVRLSDPYSRLRPFVYYFRLLTVSWRLNLSTTCSEFRLRLSIVYLRLFYVSLKLIPSKTLTRYCIVVSRRSENLSRPSIVLPGDFINLLKLSVVHLRLRFLCV